MSITINGVEFHQYDAEHSKKTRMSNKINN